jgi:hypothetical protein
VQRKTIPLTPISHEPAGAPEKSTPAAVAALLALPKPILFGLFGGVGGLLGALLLGELLWLLLSPSGVGGPPPLQVAAPPSVAVYSGGKNRFLVKIARAGFEGPVQVEAVEAHKEINVDPVRIDADKDQASVEVRVTNGLGLGKYPVKVQARALVEKPIPAAIALVEVAVEPMPPALAVAASPRVQVDQGGKGRFTVRFARARFQGDVHLRFSGMPAGVVIPEQLIPQDKVEARVEVSVPVSCPVAESQVNVEASGLLEGAGISKTTNFTLAVQKRPDPTVDVLFLLDLTGSMGFAIEGVKKGIQSFVEGMVKEKIDARVGLVCFRDIEADRERPFVVKFDGEVFTRDPRVFRDKMTPLKAEGGGDEPESSLQALALATEQPFRAKAKRVLVLITDAPPKIHRDESISTVEQTVEALKRREIDQVHLVIRQRDRDSASAYKQLKSDFTGEFFDIESAAKGGEKTFAGLLPSLSKAISRLTIAAAPRESGSTEPPPLPEERGASFAPPPEEPVLKAVQSTQAFAARDRFRLLLAIVVWTMVTAAAISLFIAAGQQLHTRSAWVDLPGGGKAVAGGLLAGMAGGAVGQLVFQSIAGGGPAWESACRVLGWGLLGGLIGAVMSFFIPNLKWWRGTLGGVVGGLLGALAFVLVSLLLGALLGRWMGAAILGFCIGLMVALAELAFRRYWLEIAVSPREVRAVTLGTAAVSVGGDERLASFFVAGAPAVALRYLIERDRVVCEDLTTGEVGEVEPGDTRALGKVAIKVCSPASSQTTGYALHLSNGRTVPLQEGMPLTAEDVPGLQPRGQDGIVAIVSRHPTQPREVSLRNRSSQAWSARNADGGTQVVEPGRGLELADGARINFGQVQGEIIAQKPARR